jgi:hypothetical protein
MHLYPQFWLQLKDEHIFLLQLIIIKSQFYHRHIGANRLFILSLLDEALFDEQTMFLKMTMISNGVAVMKPRANCNPYS